jgi:hypothetical protein
MPSGRSKKTGMTGVEWDIHLLVYVDDANMLGVNINIINKTQELC